MEPVEEKKKHKAKKAKKEKALDEDQMAAQQGLKAVVMGGTGEIGRVRRFLRYFAQFAVCFESVSFSGISTIGYPF